VQLAVHTLESAPAASVPVLEGIEADLGLTPNLARTVAESPTLLQAFDALRRAAAATSIDPVHREVAGLATGVAVGGAYGVAFHSTVLGRLGVAEAEIDRMRAGQPPTDPVLAVVHRLATELAARRGDVDDDTVAAARAAGFTDAAILEVAVEVSFASLVGVVDTLAERVPLDEFLQPRAWTAATHPTA
jgi:alkylhydroperoxidase family enzyme